MAEQNVRLLEVEGGDRFMELAGDVLDRPRWGLGVAVPVAESFDDDDLETLELTDERSEVQCGCSRPVAGEHHDRRPGLAVPIDIEMAARDCHPFAVGRQGLPFTPLRAHIDECGDDHDDQKNDYDDARCAGEPTPAAGPTAATRRESRVVVMWMTAGRAIVVVMGLSSVVLVCVCGPDFTVEFAR